MCHVWSIFPRLNLKLFEVVMQSVSPNQPLLFFNHREPGKPIHFGIPACWKTLIHDSLWSAVCLNAWWQSFDSRIQAAEPIAYHCVRIQEIHRTNSSLHWLQFNVQLKASNLNVSILLLLYVLHSCVPKVLSMLLRHGMNQCSLDPLGLFDACKNAMLCVVNKQTGCQNCRLTRLPG